ncbi:MAG: hypothetical protein IPK85_00080 [Gemmatimonadetes bacterium]|nr:hypothetical protein [Gemmatimonadota bacterium]
MDAIDIANPAAPVVTDSIVTNTRRVGDIMTTPDWEVSPSSRRGRATGRTES